VFHPFGESATLWIARFLGRTATLQLLGMERPFRVAASCPASQKPHTPQRPTAVSRIIVTGMVAYREFDMPGIIPSPNQGVLSFGHGINRLFWIKCYQNKNGFSFTEYLVVDMDQ